MPFSHFSLLSTIIFFSSLCFLYRNQQFKLTVYSDSPIMRFAYITGCQAFFMTFILMCVTYYVIFVETRRMFLFKKLYAESWHIEFAYARLYIFVRVHFLL